MVDIVERLRKLPKVADCKEAADEIERLRLLLGEVGVSSKKPKPKNIKIVEGSIHYEFLAAFAENKTLTTDEAGVYLNIPEGRETYGWWNKVSDLKSAGYVFETELRLKSRAGVEVHVWAITPKGLKDLEDAGYSGK